MTKFVPTRATIKTMPPANDVSGPVIDGCSAFATSRMKTRS